MQATKADAHGMADSGLVSMNGGLHLRTVRGDDGTHVKGDIRGDADKKKGRRHRQAKGQAAVCAGHPQHVLGHSVSVACATTYR